MVADPSPTMNPFRRLWDAGYHRLVPIVPPDAVLSPHSSLFKRPGGRGKAVGELGPHGWRGFNWHKHVTVEDDLERWHAMGAGVGCRMGEGLVAIDIDALDKVHALAAMEAAFEILGPAPIRIGRSPKMLLLYRCAVDVAYQRVEFAGADGTTQRVEVLGPGQQAVFDAIHPGTMKPYRWPNGLPAFGDLAETTLDAVRAFFDRLLDVLPEAVRPASSNAQVRDLVDQDKLTGDLEAIQAAVAAIPNDRSDRSWYLRMGYAIKAALRDHPDEAFDLFWEWCGRWTVRDKDHDKAWSFWTSLQPPFAIGAPYLYGLASKHTGENMAPVGDYFEDESDGTEPAPAPKPPMQFVRFDEAAHGALQDGALPLIKGLIDQGAMSVVYGESNVGKTFVTMDMAYHIARGLPWGGMKTTKAAVVYLSLEGGRGAKRRAAALARKLGPCADFYFILTPLNLLRADADLKPLIEAIRALGVVVGLIVVDTLSRALAGGDENSSTDMGAIVRHLDVLRGATNAHLMVVHHSGKDKAKGARGHSLLRAATDTEIEIADRQLSVTKQRDLDKSYASAFELDVVTLGADGDGDPITSCTVRLLAHVAQAAPGVATPKERQVLDAIETLADTSDPSGAGFSVADITAMMPVEGINAVRHLIRELTAKNLLIKAGRGRWRPRDKVSADAFFNVEKSPFD